LLNIQHSMAWHEPTSSEYLSSCGSTGANTPEVMLDATDAWYHLVAAEHELVLDLGSQIDISKFGFRGDSEGGGTEFAPLDMDVYISTDNITYGTAVLTGVDTTPYNAGSYGEFTGTRKTGRYIKFIINSTNGGAPGILAWGDGIENRPVIRYWDGDIPKKWTTVIPLRGSYDNNYSTTYTYTDGRRGIIPLDGSKYNNVIGVLGMGVLKRSGTSGVDPNPKTFMECYDRTNTQQIVEVINQLESYETEVSTVDGVDNFPSGAAFIDVRYKKTDALSSQHMNFEMHITQESEDSGNKTCIYIPLSAYTSSFSTSYTGTGGWPAATAPTEYHFKYLEADWDCTIDKVYLTTTSRTNGGATVSMKLDDIAQGGALVTQTHNTTTYTEQSSSDISSSLVDDTIYKLWVKSTTGSQSGDIICDAYLVFEISDMNAFPTFQNVGILGNVESTTTGWVEEPEQMVEILDNDMEYFSSEVTRVLKHQTVLYNNRATSMSSSVYDDGTRISAADLLTTARADTWMESGAITPADGSDITFASNLQKSFLGSGKAESSLLIRYISGLDLGGGGGGTNTEINIGDVWKTVDSMQINIGDTWKDVESVQINIGDVWKDVY